MALTQNDPAITELDGLHPVPKLDWWIAKGFSKEIEQGMYETVVRGQRFIDYKVDLKGVVYNDAYELVSTFKPNNDYSCVFIGKNRAVFREEKSYGSRNPRVFFDKQRLEPLTAKLDGKQFRLTSDGRSCFLIDRKGRARVGHSSGQFDLVLEWYKEKFYLIQVLKYKKWRPFHGYHNMANFLRNVKIALRIDGKTYWPELPPIVDDPLDLDPEHEGIVTRDHNGDFLLRKYPSFDLKQEDLRKTKHIFSEFGHPIKVEYEGPPGINEYLLKGDFLYFHKARPEKKFSR